MITKELAKIEQIKKDVLTYEMFIGNVMVTPYLLDNLKWLIEKVEQNAKENTNATSLR